MNRLRPAEAVLCALAFVAWCLAMTCLRDLPRPEFASASSSIVVAYAGLLLFFAFVLSREKEAPKDWH